VLPVAWTVNEYISKTLSVSRIIPECFRRPGINVAGSDVFIRMDQTIGSRVREMSELNSGASRKFTEEGKSKAPLPVFVFRNNILDDILAVWF